MDIRPPIPVIIQYSCDHAEVSVSSSSCTEKTLKILQRQSVESRKLKDTDTEEESR